MVPKKDQLRKTKIKCPYNDRGYCKFGEECINKHSDKVCNDNNCKEEECDERHPNPCKFGNRCKHNKLKLCSYSHVTFASNDGRNDALEKRLEVLEIQVKEIKKKDGMGKESNKKIEALEKTIEKKENRIVTLEEKIKIFENKFSEVKTLEIKLNDAENHLQKQAKTNKALSENLSKLQAIVKKNEKQLFRCDQCDFSSVSEQGLKTHSKRKHTNAVIEKEMESFPKMCSLCEKQFDCEITLKRHMKTHSYKQIEYRCEECDFLGATPFTMEVHLGKSHSDKFECGLCEFVAKDLETLDMHLFTCEIYQCEECEKRFKNIKDIKEHLTNEHGAYTTLIHAKQSRADNDEIDMVEYSKNFFITNN